MKPNQLYSRSYSYLAGQSAAAGTVLHRLGPAALLYAILIFPAGIVHAQGCPAGMLANGKHLMQELRFDDAISTFRSIDLLWPVSAEAEEARFLIIVSYRELADRQRSVQWLSKAREAIRRYNKLHPKGRFTEQLNEESGKVEAIETSLTGVSKNIFIAFVSIAIGSVIALALISL